ncbi:MAG: ACP phosphodiesterase [Lentisphaeraceae bacterium]|nr:ACP phosphodiesterase [Lentisphaeraceae bacterium]
MNWLAHVFLSPDDVNFKIGNLLTDVSKPEHLEIKNDSFQAGIRCHYEIDRFTDTHDLVKKCKKVFFPKYRHFSAVLVDVFYDHFLAAHWQSYSDISYREYVNDFYSLLKMKTLPLHKDSEIFIESIYTSDRLGIYDRIEGVKQALERISSRIRLRTKIDIRESIVELNENYDVLLSDFRAFFSQLRSHVKDFN